MPRPKKPVKILELTGNRGKRKLRKEPTPKIDLPQPPNYLDAKAIEEWFRVVPELKELGLLTKLDVTSLAVYCQACSNFQQATELINNNGIMVRYENKISGVNPAMKIIESSTKQIRAFCNEFGFTPASRVKLGTDKKGDDDKEKSYFDKYGD